MPTRWERETGKFYRYSEADGLPRAAPTAYCQDRRANLWIGFYTGGLVRYSHRHFRLFSGADGTAPGMIRGLNLDRAGRLWIATSQGGASQVDDPNADQPRFVTYTTAVGLASNYVSCFTEDQWGRLYIGTGRGVDRLDPVTGRIKHYTTGDGLASSEVNVAFRDRHGGLWFGMLLGISGLPPQPAHAASPPPILITGLLTDGIPVPISELGRLRDRASIKFEVDPLDGEFSTANNSIIEGWAFGDSSQSPTGQEELDLAIENPTDSSVVMFFEASIAPQNPSKDGSSSAQEAGWRVVLDAESPRVRPGSGCLLHMSLYPPSPCEVADGALAEISIPGFPQRLGGVTLLARAAKPADAQITCRTTLQGKLRIRSQLFERDCTTFADVTGMGAQ